MFKEQGVISSWTVLGSVGNKVKFQALSTFRVNLLLSTSPVSMLLWSAVFICGQGGVGEVVRFLKNNLGMCVRPLSISFRKLGVCDSVMWKNYRLLPVS